MPAYMLHGCCIVACIVVLRAGNVCPPVDWHACLQVRDEYRTDWDAGRGGYGNIVKQELAARQEAIKGNMEMYAEGQGEEADAEEAEDPADD